MALPTIANKGTATGAGAIYTFPFTPTGSLLLAFISRRGTAIDLTNALAAGWSLVARQAWAGDDIAVIAINRTNQTNVDVTSYANIHSVYVLDIAGSLVAGLTSATTTLGYTSGMLNGAALAAADGALVFGFFGAADLDTRAGGTGYTFSSSYTLDYGDTQPPYDLAPFVGLSHLVSAGGTYAPTGQMIYNTSTADFNSWPPTWAVITVAVASSDPPGPASGGPSLLIEYFDNNGTTFGPATLQGVIHDAVKIGWSWYSRHPANAFFTLRQTSVHNARLSALLTHIRITYYNPRTGYSVVVFTGRLSEPDYSGEDVVWTAWNYLAELSLSRTGYRVMYPSKKLGTEIAALEWALARTATYALLNFVTTGTIENPLDIGGTIEITTDVRFGVIDVPRLLLMFDLTEIGRANTVNNVTFGISRTSPFTFTFLKNAGTYKSGRRFIYPGNVRDFRYVPGFASLRNDLATIGTGSDGNANEIVKTDEANAATYGRRQDVFTIKTLAGSAAGATESDAQQAVTARAVKEATSLSKQLLLDLRPELIEPFDGWDLEDTITVEVTRGPIAISAPYRIIGARGLLDERGYHPQLYIQLPTT